ncbi:uncharacterized protein LOC120357902 [Solenopsis invicta]|uniref:uncharacterized protein LOC120357902 n=1 Tax=Solenopsis invicta TaxID=13686 RepID=UPI00193CA9A1|nr:uncharacterized protein LOC120357902 [Solenopsis invicta]
MDLPPHSYFLMGAAPSSVLCTVYHPLRRVEWSKAERSGIERCGHPPLMNVILRRGERNTAACLPSLVPLHPFLPPTHALPAPDSIPLAPFTPLPSSLLYQLPPRQPTNLSFVSLLRQLRLSQVDTQLQNIQFERKVKTKWIFHHHHEGSSSQQS